MVVYPKGVHDMTSVGSKWSEIGERLEALALKLKLHFAQTRDGEGDGADALDRLRKDIENAFEAAGNAVKDDAVRSDVKDVGVMFANAFSATLEKAASELREAANRRKS